MAYRGWRRNGTKYNATKVTIDGHTFDSKKESNYYLQLRMLERAGEISNLELQKRYELIPPQYEPDKIVTLKSGKQKVVQGKCAERAVYYLADFVYLDNRTGATVVVDCKSPATITPEYVIKRKLLRYKYGIAIQEV